jgi:hypothetical protein
MGETKYQDLVEKQQVDIIDDISTDEFEEFEPTKLESILFWFQDFYKAHFKAILNFIYWGTFLLILSLTMMFILTQKGAKAEDLQSNTGSIQQLNEQINLILIQRANELEFLKKMRYERMQTQAEWQNRDKEFEKIIQESKTRILDLDQKTNNILTQQVEIAKIFT